MDRHAYYEDLKSLARAKREQHGVDTAAFGLREVRSIYRSEGIRIDYYLLPAKIKALYMCADGDYTVAVQRTLPDEPKLFALVHELKHHYCDQEILGSGVIHCGDYNMDEVIEIGAEVFAAEFIYPQQEFAMDLGSIGVQVRRPDDVVNLKRRCKAKVSYRYLCKRLEQLGLIEPRSFDGVKFRNLEDQMYGTPFYRRKNGR